MDSNKRIGDYEILEELGRGGMGRVYKVRNIISDRIEAMKVLLPDLVGRQDLAARFVREIKVLATLQHPHIASLRTALSADNQLVMIMEFVEGQSLAHRVRNGAIPVNDALSYIDQVLDALGYAHVQGVVHRDIKPANMMLAPDGTVKLTDFGIARARNDQTLTIAGTTTGSLSYMSPEQVNGEDTDARSDLYSVGISLYELVTGQRPFNADSDFAVMVAHLKEAPRPPIELQPALGPELNEVILKSIAKDPKDRYQTAGEFRQALSALPSATGMSASASAATIVGAGAVKPSAAPTQVLGVPAGAPVNFAPDKSTTVAPSGYPNAVVPPLPPAAASMAVPPPKQGHPAVYVALGGVLMIGAIVAAGLYIGQADARPGPASTTAAPAPAVTPAPSTATPAAATGASTAAAESTAASAPAAPPAPAAPSAPAPDPTASSVPPVVPAPAAAPRAETPARTTEPAGRASEPAPRARTAESSTRPPAASTPASRATTSAPAAAATAPSTESRPAGREAAQPGAPSPAANAADFDELENDVDQLINRAAAVEQSLNVMQQQQARQGLSMRGDIVARQNSMKSNLTRAQQAVAQRDSVRAKRFIDLAEADVAALEKFLGR